MVLGYCEKCIAWAFVSERCDLEVDLLSWNSSCGDGYDPHMGDFGKLNPLREMTGVNVRGRFAFFPCAAGTLGVWGLGRVATSLSRVADTIVTREGAV